MSKKDTLAKEYMRQPDRFADFFNGYIYHGKEVIKPDDLTEVDSSNIAVIPYTKNAKTITVQKYRDILKKVILMKSDKAYFLFLGIENQSDIHYAMPVRNMLYDALVYNQQVEEIARKNRELGISQNSAEFLSGFTKNDKLIPVLTVTVYWGAEPWDAPVSLASMFIETDDAITELIQDYDCNLFSIVDAESLPDYKTELNELFSILNASSNGKSLRELVIDNPLYESVSKDTAKMIHEFTNIKLPRKTKEGKYNMCKAILELKQEGIDEARVEAIKNIMRNAEKSFEDACDLLCINAEDALRYKELV